MNNLQNKKILIGVSGSIAAYKIPELIRIFRKEGAEVKVVMTDLARLFVTPLVLQAISGYPVLENRNGMIVDNQEDCSIRHIDLGRWADLILLAPATADLLARMSIGMTNDLLTAICLAAESEKKIAIAPSMNKQMYQSKTTQKNISILKSRGMLIWGPCEGEQICGEFGLGRMIEPIQIVNLTSRLFQYDQDMKGIRIMVTAGPTQEKIDVMKFLSNYSSGKMGFAIAQASAERGAEVTLISGPVHLDTPPCVHRINVISALEMNEEVQKIIKKQDIFVGCAAVSDYRPKQFLSEEKIDSDLKNVQLTLTKNPDIIKNIGRMNSDRPYTIGFSAETRMENLISNSYIKKTNKNLDLICANNIALKNHGFHTEGNSLHLVWSKDKFEFIPYDHKIKISHQLLSKILPRYEEKSKHQNT
ncbi:bifunctional phosphopantothenoylcysteine decarboxylase/phosphopantothenate--cysteine ligase CoaBC [Candidatus Riesia pediculischaeffi]|nr:bifunctional phosphopantothenoylcysteine decarboxylase/phosphopantothenate--cysteine ligase CoaBC [Candidatus Riesia pediculischaeffi]